MIVCVTGCGPTLSMDHVPRGAFVIGVNTSFEVVEPHIICTLSPTALKAIRTVNRKEPLYYEMDAPFSEYRPIAIQNGQFNLSKRRRPQRRTGALTSGSFGIWVASLFSPARLVLVGFKGKGHFASENPILKDLYATATDSSSAYRMGRDNCLEKFITCPVEIH